MLTVHSWKDLYVKAFECGTHATHGFPAGVRYSGSICSRMDAWIPGLTCTMDGGWVRADHGVVTGVLRLVTMDFC